jgi:hypothetical protein
VTASLAVSAASFEVGIAEAKNTNEIAQRLILMKAILSGPCGSSTPRVDHQGWDEYNIAFPAGVIDGSTDS